LGGLAGTSSSAEANTVLAIISAETGSLDA
jgi:hypothetical protein